MTKRIIITLTDEENDFMRWIATKKGVKNQELLKNIVDEHFRKEKSKYWSAYLNDIEFLLSEPIGQRISRIRKEKGVTQAELAKKCGISMQQISEWERGYRNPKISNAEKIARALGVSVNELIKK